MVKLIISTVTLSLIFVFLLIFSGCTKEDPSANNKTNIQYLADKEKELNEREAKIRLKEIELEEREKKMGVTTQTADTQPLQMPDTTNMTAEQKKEVEKKMKEEEKKVKDEKKKENKKEIQKEMTKKFEDPKVTVKDYYEYIQRGINETGNFDANMQKAHKYFPSRPVDKLKGGYRNTKSFTVVDEPKVVSQKDNKSVVQTKVKQTEVIKKDGKDTEVTKTLLVTYNLTANKEGQWVISSNSVRSE